MSVINPPPSEAVVSDSEKELEILEHIHRRAEEVHQRDLARIVGLSLGMTNAIVRRLAQKGWIKVRKVNNRNIRYAVTPAGVDQITRRSYRYLKRTIRNIVDYREAIEQFVRDVKSHGYCALVLVGESDLDFIVEHACEAADVHYVRNDREAADGDQTADGTLPASTEGKEPLFLLYSESYIPDAEEKARGENIAFLQEVVGGAAHDVVG